MSTNGDTNLERQIRSQPGELERILASTHVREKVHEAAEGLHRARRLWVVGTGTSQHAAFLGSGMLQEAGRAAHAVSSMQFVQWAPIVGPQDAVVVITHTAETSYALAARALAFQAGLDTIMITRTPSDFPDAIDLVEKESAETYTVSYTAAVLALAMLAKEMGAESVTDEVLARVPGAVADAIASPGIDDVAAPKRLLCFVGAGPAAVTAREGALKIREGARLLAEGFDAEYLLHGSAVPLGTADRLVTLSPPADELTAGIAVAARAEGIPVSEVAEPAGLPAILAQIPLTVRLQLLALRLAQESGADPDTVITGAWADEGLWSIGKPTA